MPSAARHPVGERTHASCDSRGAESSVEVTVPQRSGRSDRADFWSAFRHQVAEFPTPSARWRQVIMVGHRIVCLVPGRSGRLRRPLIECTFVHTSFRIDYEWDPARELASELGDGRKHGVRFADTVIALEDPLALTKLDANGHQAVRFVSLGMDGCGRLLVTVFTHRGDRVRIISARPATPGERRQYEGAT